VRDIESSPYCDPCETGADEREAITLSGHGNGIVTGEGKAPSDISRHARKRDERGLHICGVALCGSSSRRTWTDETVTCPKCLRLLAKEVR
jgi:hypothetical protein